MKNLIFLSFVCILYFNTSFSQSVEFEEYKLNNGLNIILHKDNSAPVINTTLMFNVGAKNEESDKTGFAHFFEHLLGKETKNMKSGEWYKILSSNGGNGNAATSVDLTYYYATMPSNSLKLGLWRYSEIMLHPIIDQEGIDIQREAVKEEKRIRDNQPYSRFYEALKSNLFEKHSYKNPLIGAPEHLDNAVLQDFLDFRTNFYMPSNAVFVVAGDIEINKTKELISEYFSEIPAAPINKREIILEDPILAEIRATEYDPNIQIPAVIIGFRTPSMKSREARIFDLISTYLSDGPSSKLYKRMVDKNKTALQVQALNIGHEDYSMYAILSLPLGETSLEELTKEIEEEIVKIQENLISENDYEKLQNKFENQFVNSNSSVSGIGVSLAQYFTLYGDTNLINSEIDIYRSISRQEIRETAIKYLNTNQRLILEYLPENDKK
jgi:zinc protease